MNPETQKPRFIPTTDGCFVDPAAVFLAPDGKSLLVPEWAPDSACPERVTFDEAQECATACTLAGGGWSVASPKVWMASGINHEKEDPASDLPDAQPDWYWTSQPDPSSSGDAVYVLLRLGRVDWGNRNGRGRARFVRLVPASQF
ncbi:MAG: DUF1566 domain-containing protein [Nevskiaceae bacterium]|nr:MAG: DUF1566 domain-containing protein [Nevskiaceae bacterium]